VWNRRRHGLEYNGNLLLYPVWYRSRLSLKVDTLLYPVWYRSTDTRLLKNIDVQPKKINEKELQFKKKNKTNPYQLKQIL
jgi:hypothetical protein